MLRSSVLLSVTLILLAGVAAFGDGMLIPGPPTHIIPDEPYFTVKYHHVKVEIEDQVCTTYVDQVFVNDSRREMEATYLFPLPPGAVVTEFVLIADGKEIEARLLDKDEAQKIYEEIVRKRKDPAILTYAGNNAYQARIYPIPPKGERRVELRYSESAQRRAPRGVALLRGATLRQRPGELSVSAQPRGAVAQAD